MTRADELLGALDPERRAQLEAARTSRTFGAVDEVLAAAGFPRRSEKGGVSASSSPSSSPGGRKATTKKATTKKATTKKAPAKKATKKATAKKATTKRR